MGGDGIDHLPVIGKVGADAGAHLFARRREIHVDHVVAGRHQIAQHSATELAAASCDHHPLSCHDVPIISILLRGRVGSAHAHEPSRGAVDRRGHRPAVGDPRGGGHRTAVGPLDAYPDARDLRRRAPGGARLGAITARVRDRRRVAGLGQHQRRAAGAAARAGRAGVRRVQHAAHGRLHQDRTRTQRPSAPTAT